MDHQDWNTLYLNCKPVDKTTDKPGKITTYVANPEKKMEKQIEDGKLKHNIVDPDFSKKSSTEKIINGINTKTISTKIKYASSNNIRNRKWKIKV